MNEQFLLACTYCESSSTFGPRAWGDYIIAGVAVLIVGWTLRKAASLLLNPGEQDPKHIKTQVLEAVETEAERS